LLLLIISLAKKTSLLITQGASDHTQSSRLYAEHSQNNKQAIGTALSASSGHSEVKTVNQTPDASLGVGDVLM